MENTHQTDTLESTLAEVTKIEVDLANLASRQDRLQGEADALLMSDLDSDESAASKFAIVWAKLQSVPARRDLLRGQRDALSDTLDAHIETRKRELSELVLAAIESRRERLIATLTRTLHIDEGEASQMANESSELGRLAGKVPLNLPHPTAGQRARHLLELQANILAEIGTGIEQPAAKAA